MKKLRSVVHKPCGQTVTLGYRPVLRVVAGSPPAMVPTAVLVCPTHGEVPMTELDPPGGVCLVFGESQKESHG